MSSRIATHYHAINMLKLSQIYEEFLTLFRPKKSKSTEEQIALADQYSGSIFFGLVDSSDSVDIRCSLPDVKECSIEQIASIAEKYAELLVYINTEKFSSYIDEILDKKKNKDDDYKNIMLIDNIKDFRDILYKIEIKKEYKRHNKEQPLVRPTQAFSLK